jgi:hypothetical protein
MNPKNATLAFVDAINRGEPDRLADLMTPGHVFIDSLGEEHVGRDSMVAGWRRYLEMVPDYHIEVRQILEDETAVVLLGVARGTWSADGALDPADRWETPAAWRAVVEGDRLATWQVFADNEPIRAVMRAHGVGQGG